MEYYLPLLVGVFVVSLSVSVLVANSRKSLEIEERREKEQKLREEVSTKCPSCAESVLLEAEKCKSCGADVRESNAIELARRARVIEDARLAKERSYLEKVAEREQRQLEALRMLRSPLTYVVLGLVSAGLVVIGLGPYSAQGKLMEAARNCEKSTPGDYVVTINSERVTIATETFPKNHPWLKCLNRQLRESGVLGGEASSEPVGSLAEATFLDGLHQFGPLEYTVNHGKKEWFVSFAID